MGSLRVIPACSLYSPLSPTATVWLVSLHFPHVLERPFLFQWLTSVLSVNLATPEIGGGAVSGETQDTIEAVDLCIVVEKCCEGR